MVYKPTYNLGGTVLYQLVQDFFHHVQLGIHSSKCGMCHQSQWLHHYDIITIW